MFTLGLEEVQFPNYMQRFLMFYGPNQTSPLHFRLQLKLVGISMNGAERALVIYRTLMPNR